MLRGNHPATIDAKGRLKIPAAFLDVLRESGEEFFVTSEKGDVAWIYPMKEWQTIEERLSRLSSHNAVKQKFLNRTSYYGQEVVLDAQGRILIPAILRESAQMKGEVVVIGKLNRLEVWNHQRFVEMMNQNPITPEDEKVLDELGI
jgi:MraZ protein